MKCRKKPVVVEAVQWWGFDKTPDNLLPDIFQGVIGQLPRFKAIYIGLTLGMRQYKDPPCKMGWVETLEGGHIISHGDFLIRGIKGEFYPCKPDIFDLTYEDVE